MLLRLKVTLYLSVYIFLSIHLFTYQSIYQSIYLSIYISIYLPKLQGISVDMAQGLVEEFGTPRLLRDTIQTIWNVLPYV